MQIDIHAKGRNVVAATPSSGEGAARPVKDEEGPVPGASDIPKWEPRAQKEPFVSSYTPYTAEGATNLEGITKSMIEKK